MAGLSGDRDGDSRVGRLAPDPSESSSILLCTVEGDAF